MQDGRFYHEKAAEAMREAGQEKLPNARLKQIFVPLRLGERWVTELTE